MVSTDIQIRFGDCDMAGHVHNAAYLHYFETARISFFVSELGIEWDWKKNGLILKKSVIEYHSPVYLEDQIKIDVSTIDIGSKSFTLSYSVFDSNNVLKAYGESVIVCYDYNEMKTIEIPHMIRTMLTGHMLHL